MDKSHLVIYQCLLSWKQNMGKLPTKSHLMDFKSIIKYRFHFLENFCLVVTVFHGDLNRNIIEKIKLNLSKLYFIYILTIILCIILMPAKGCTMNDFRPNTNVQVNEDENIGKVVLTFDAAPVSAITLDIKTCNSLNDIFNVTMDASVNRYAVVVAQPLDLLLPNCPVLEAVLICQGPAVNSLSKKSLNIGIVDVNNKIPHFVMEPYKATVNELSPVGFLVFDGIKAEDDDLPDTSNSQFIIKIISGDPDKIFIIQMQSFGASLFLNKTLDYEKQSEDYNLTLQVKDFGVPSLSSTSYITVSVEDGDDQAPVFTHTLYRGNISDPPSSNIEIMPPIHAYDQDKGINETLQYAIATGPEFFSIDEKTGELSLIRHLTPSDLATGPWTLTIEASQVNDPQKKAVAAVVLRSFQKTTPLFVESIHQRMIPDNPKQGDIVARMMPLLRDKLPPSNTLQYSIISGNEKELFSIDSKSGDIIITKIDNGSLFINSGDKPAFQLTIMAQDRTLSSTNGTILVQFFVSSQENPPNEIHVVEVAGVASWVIILIVCLGILLVLVITILAVVCYKSNKAKNKVLPSDSTMNGSAVNGSTFALMSPSPISMDSIGIGNHVDGIKSTDPPYPPDPYNIYYIKVDQLRRDAQRSETIEDMTLVELQQEKNDVRQVLLWYQREHGKPITKLERQIMRPLYNRYRKLKKCLLQNT